MKKLLSILIIIAISAVPVFAEKTDSDSIIQVDTPVTDNLSEPGDINSYTFEIDKPGKIVLIFEHEDLEREDEFWRISLTDNSDEVLAVFTSKGNSVSDNSSNRYLGAGKYHIIVQQEAVGDAAWAFNDAEYTLTAEFTENTGQFEIEPNDTKETATPVYINSSITGNLYKEGDADWYKLTLESPGYVVLQLRHEDLGINRDLWRVTLESESGIVYIDFTSRGEIIHDSFNNPVYSEGFVFLSAGDYYIKVSQKHDGEAFHNEDNYDLFVEFQENTGNYEIEPNNRKSDATVIGTDTPIWGNLHSNDDVDWFKFTLLQADKVWLYFKGVKNAQVDLIDVRNNSLLTSTFTYINEDEIDLKAGIYYVRIKSTGLIGSAENSYVFSVVSMKDHNNAIGLDCSKCGRAKCRCVYCDYCYRLDRICDCVFCGDCKELEENCTCIHYILGDVTGTGIIEIDDALEILKYLAGLENIINDERSMSAACITGKIPVIDDVLEILKHLAGIDGKLSSR